MDPEWVVVFDIARKPPDVMFTMFGAAFLLASAAAARTALRRREYRLAWSAASAVLVILGSMWLVVGLAPALRPLLDPQMDDKVSASPVVEGPVTNFRPMLLTGHGYESFDVDGVGFSYSDFHSTPFFNQTASHGGPVREGLYVRIHYVYSEIGNEPMILRLEVRR